MNGNRKTFVLVVGMHRSGTSLLAKGMEALGVDLGVSMLEPAEDNPKGFWESKPLVEINEELLVRNRERWDSLILRELDFSDGLYDDLRQKVLRILDSDFHGEVCGFKDPRTSRLLGFWVPLLSEQGYAVKLVLSVRNPDAVARSLAVRNGIPAETTCALWMEHVIGVTERGLPSLVVDYGQLLDQPLVQLHRVAGYLGLNMDRRGRELAQFDKCFVDRELCHHAGEEGLESVSELCRLTARMHSLLQECGELSQFRHSPEWESIIETWSQMSGRLENTLLAVDGLVQEFWMSKVDQLTHETEKLSSVNEGLRKELDSIASVNESRARRILFLKRPW